MIWLTGSPFAKQEVPTIIDTSKCLRLFATNCPLSKSYVAENMLPPINAHSAQWLQRTCNIYTDIHMSPDKINGRTKFSTWLSGCTHNQRNQVYGKCWLLCWIDGVTTNLPRYSAARIQSWIGLSGTNMPLDGSLSSKDSLPNPLSPLNMHTSNILALFDQAQYGQPHYVSSFGLCLNHYGTHRIHTTTNT